METQDLEHKFYGNSDSDSHKDVTLTLTVTVRQEITRGTIGG